MRQENDDLGVLYLSEGTINSLCPMSLARYPVLCGPVTSFFSTAMDVTRPGTWDGMTHGKPTTMGPWAITDPRM